MRHYIMQLIPWLLRLSEHELTIFFTVQGQPSLARVLCSLSLAELRRVQLIEIDDQEQIFRHAHDFDVYFCPLNGFAPGLLDRPTLGTLADIQDQFFPQYFTAQQLELRKQLYPYMARAVTTLLTISEFSKRCICDAFGIPDSKVQVTYLAPSDDVLHAKPQWPSYLPSLPDRYVFYPANLYPHKNHELLLQSIRVLRDQYGIDCACVMTGHEASPGVAISERIEAHGLRGHARWLGYVPPAALRYLYTNAEALAFPSRFEGFGMPLVEAMLCDCPIVATPTTCIPEIVGDAALLAEGTEKEFAAALARVLREKAERRRLIENGRERLKLFNARSMAEATLRAIEDAPARFMGPSRTVSEPAISFVVCPSAGDASFTRTLASLAYEARDHDEILVLAEPHELSPKAVAFCDNLGTARFLTSVKKAGNWIEDVRHDLVCYLREGETLCRGACRAVQEAFAESASCQAVVGQAIEVDGHGRCVKNRFVPTDAPIKIMGRMIPPAAVFWRRAFVQSKRDLLEKELWTNWLLQTLVAEESRILYRTLATVDSAVHSAPAPAFVVQLAQDLSTLKKHNPSLRLRQIAWSSIAQQLARSKQLVRRLARIMPESFEARLRSFYFRKICPYLTQR
jgi:glycosyltransferase involved in cell wall biosynthesis